MKYRGKNHSLGVGLAYIQRKHPVHRLCFPSSDLKELDGWGGCCDVVARPPGGNGPCKE